MSSPCPGVLLLILMYCVAVPLPVKGGHLEYIYMYIYTHTVAYIHMTISIYRNISWFVGLFIIFKTSLDVSLVRLKIFQTCLPPNKNDQDKFALL